jgi:hypothetical protein
MPSQACTYDVKSELRHFKLDKYPGIVLPKDLFLKNAMGSNAIMMEPSLANSSLFLFINDNSQSSSRKASTFSKVLGFINFVANSKYSQKYINQSSEACLLVYKCPGVVLKFPFRK